MKKKIVYFHGYGSTPNSDKVKSLSEYVDVYAPSIPVKYEEAKVYLEQFLNNIDFSDVVFVGTSLGGYWATVMAEQFGVPAVIINPSCKPAETLSFYNNPILTNEELLKYKELNPTNASNKIVLLAKDDDVIPYEIAEQKFRDVSKVKLFENGGHRFNCINIILENISEISNYNFVSAYDNI